ncbi:MAG: M48 family metallopeptidase [Betaproteobacteria bacterium]|nr:M48 family metallopeptidase [Betaproteobacteria bacterium]
MSAAPEVPAHYHDGRSARRFEVTLQVEDGVAHVTGEGVQRSAPLASLRISEPMGAAPRLITFADGAFCEVRDHAALARLLAATGHRDRAHVRWQFAPRAVALAVIGVALLALGIWRFALPLAAQWVAPSIPEAVGQELSAQVLEVLDAHLLGPSALPEPRTRDLAARFAAMPASEGAQIPHRVLFRDGRRLGANAFALPDGSIVVTDQLLALAADDDQVMAVLGHELGHVQERHGLRLVLQGSMVALFMTWYVGDVSTLLAAAPTVLIQARYSRDMEREADAWAARWLRANGLSPLLLSGMLERLEAAHRRAASEGGETGYLDSHPASGDRIRALREIP